MLLPVAISDMSQSRIAPTQLTPCLQTRTCAVQLDGCASGFRAITRCGFAWCYWWYEAGSKLMFVYPQVAYDSGDVC